MTKILVIEDEETVRDIIEELLSSENFDVVVAENGRKGVELAKASLPNLIVCDVMMPELDGYGVLEHLREHSPTRTIPFIFLTAKAAKADMRQGMELGADDYLTKPFTREELLAAISSRLHKQEAIAHQSRQQLEDLRLNLTRSLPHELLTPLNGILGMSQLLVSESDSVEPSEIYEMAESIRVSAERLYRLIQNFLLYAQLELLTNDPDRLRALLTGRTTSTRATIDSAVQERAKYYGREADVCLEILDTEVAIAENWLAKIVLELADNAFKFSNEGTPVRITGAMAERLFVLGVSDRGRGMTSEQIHHIGGHTQFDRKLYEQQGSGLGLSIVKRLVELHGGSIAIDSIPESETTVEAYLPT